VYSSLDEELEKVRGLPAFQAALDATLQNLPPHEWTLLKLYYLDGLSIDRIAPLYAVHRGTVARRVRALRDVLLRGVQQRVVRQLRPSALESYEDLLDAARSELELPMLRPMEGS
jgi:RNA polymerase sigma-70 factor (ECF subfamily)